MTLTERLTQYFLLARLHRPIGILLLLWPTLWGLWIASDGNPGVANVVVFVLGTVLMRSAGCAINDYADRDFDVHVERTKDRPLAARRISTDEAVMVAATLAFIAFLLVYFFLNKLSLYLSFAALAIAAIAIKIGECIHERGAAGKQVRLNLLERRGQAAKH